MCVAYCALVQLRVPTLCCWCDLAVTTVASSLTPQDAETRYERASRRIHELEAQIRQLTYDFRRVRKSGHHALADVDDTESVGGMTEDSFTTAGTTADPDRCCTLILLKMLTRVSRARDHVDCACRAACFTPDLAFEPGENMMEVYVVEAQLDKATLGPHDTTFALVDFYEFETQTSPFAAGISSFSRLRHQTGF